MTQAVQLLYGLDRLPGLHGEFCRFRKPLEAVKNDNQIKKEAEVLFFGVKKVIHIDVFISGILVKVVLCGCILSLILSPCLVIRSHRCGVFALRYNETCNQTVFAVTSFVDDVYVSVGIHGCYR